MLMNPSACNFYKKTIINPFCLQRNRDPDLQPLLSNQTIYEKVNVKKNIFFPIWLTLKSFKLKDS